MQQPFQPSKFVPKEIEELGHPRPDEQRLPVTLLLENVRSLQNVGAMFRSADAFGVEKVVLCGFTGKPPHREIHKAALGAELQVPWEHYEDTATALHKLTTQQTAVAALEQAHGSIPLQDFEPISGEKLILIVGNEVEGVQIETLALCHHCLEIAQFGFKHSINVATAAGIALWHITNKMRCH